MSLLGKFLANANKDNGNAGCTSSFSAYFGIIGFPLFLFVTNDIASTEYPPHLAFSMFILQIILILTLAATIPDEEGVLSSSYLFFLSTPFLANCLAINALNFTTMYYGTQSNITWNNYLLMLLLSFGIAAIFAVALSFHIKKYMKIIAKKKKVKKYGIPAILWTFIYLPIILLLISCIIQYFFPVYSLKPEYTIPFINNLINEEYILPSYGLLATILSSFFCGISLLLIFTAIQSKFKHPLVPFINDYLKHNYRKRSKSSVYRRSNKDEEGKDAYDYLRKGKFPKGNMPQLSQLVRFKFDYCLLDDFTGEMTRFDTTFVDFTSNMIAYHPNLEFLAASIGYNHAYQCAINDEDEKSLLNLLQAHNINKWEKSKCLKSKYKIWTICMEFKKKEVFTFSGGKSDKDFYEFEPDIEELIANIKSFRKKICNS